MTTEKRTQQGAQRGDSWTVSTGQAARWIGLDLELRSPRTWFGPSWAMLGGALSSGEVPFQIGSLVILAVAWLVVEPLLGSLVAQSATIARLRHESRTERVPAGRWTLPYVQPESPARRALDALADWTARFRRDWRAIGGAGERWGLLALTTLALGAVIGGWPFALVALTLTSLALVAASRPLRGEERETLGAAHFLLAWLVGHGAFSHMDYRVFLVGVGYAVLWYAWTRRPPLVRLLMAIHALLAGVLAAVQAPLSAAGVLLLAVPLFVLMPENASTQRTYLHHTQPYLMASLLLAAWGLA